MIQFINHNQVKHEAEKQLRTGFIGFICDIFIATIYYKRGTYKKYYIYIKIKRMNKWDILP
jgi:hypothetical protein